MKKAALFFSFALAILSGMAQINNVDQYQATPVVYDTITSDTGYIFTTYRNSTWDLRATFAGVSSADTIWVKIQETADGETWTNYPNLDSLQVTGNHTKGFQSLSGVAGTKLRYYVNLGSVDTVIVVKMVETLKRIY